MDATSLHGKTKATDANLVMEREWLVGLVGSMADGVIAVNNQLKVDLYNGAALSLLDQNGGLTGKSLTRLLKLYDKNNEPVNLHTLLDSTKTSTTSRDYTLRYDDGSTANLYISIAPVRLGFGATGERGFVLVLRDITREKSLEEERDEFVSVVSHELRTPLAITEGNLSNARFIVDHTSNIAEIRKALAAAYDQILYLSGLVNDLATLSRAERGVLHAEVETINPHQLATDLASEYRQQAETKHLELRTDLDPKLEALHSSKLYVREILQNFLTNAIKYTESGHVTLSAHTAANGVRFSVSDSGIGIGHGDQQKLFSKFFRSEDYRTRLHNGTGLGLYVTKKLADLLNAQITVESHLNHGSTFSLLVPDLSGSLPHAAS